MMMARSLAQIPQALALHEPQPHLVTEGYLKWKGKLSTEGAIDRIKEKRGDLIEQAQINNLFYIESSHYMSHFVEELEHIYRPRFVFLCRNARGFVESGLSRPNWYGKTKVKGSIQAFMRRTLRTGSSYVYTGDPFLDHRLDAPMHLTSRMKKLAWLWKEINSTILDGLANTPSERVFRFKLEDAGEATFVGLLRYLEIPYDGTNLRSMLETARKKPNRTTRKENLSHAWDEAAFKKITSPMMERLGYS